MTRITSDVVKSRLTYKSTDGESNTTHSHNDIKDGSADHDPSSRTVSQAIPPAIMYPQFILFGDSITQFGAGEIQRLLQQDYIRKLDIINRGFSGYTAEGGLSTLRQFLPLTYPSPQPGDPIPVPTIKLMTVFFGANDACLTGYPQHVPLPAYTTALSDIATYPVLKRHGTKVLLITPPPVNEHQLGPPLSRRAWHTAKYAQATRNLALKLDIPCVDVWSAFMREANYTGPLPPPIDYEFSEDDSKTLPGSLAVEANEALRTLLVDGLHLSARGYQVLHDTLMKVLQDRLPDYLPDNVPWVFRPWRQLMGVEETA